MRAGGVRGRLAALAIALPVLLSTTGCGEGAPDGSAGESDVALSPDYAAFTLQGDTVRVSDLRGEPVLLNVWATWCTPCRQEIPVLQELHQRHAADGLRVVGVTVDARAAEPDVRQFMEQFGMTYDVWLDPDQRILSELEAVGVPVTVLLDRQGDVAWHHVGLVRPGDEGLAAALESVLE